MFSRSHGIQAFVIYNKVRELLSKSYDRNKKNR
jgi:hypothetical protein